MNAESALQACMRGSENLVQRCARVHRGERVYILANPETKAVADHILADSLKFTDHVELEVIPPLGIHGAEPPPHVGDAMLRANVVFCLTLMSLAHTPQRRAFCDAGGRFLSLPDYSLGLLGSPSLAYDFDLAIPIAERLKIVLDAASEVRIKTAAGTDVTLSVRGRIANACPGVCDRPGMLASPPDAETHIAPVEEFSNGVVVVDGSIPCREIGRLAESVRMEVRDGRIVSIEQTGAAPQALSGIFDRHPPAARVLAEFGIGLNPLAELSGRMLEDEGCAGTIHFGFGSNATIGGRNVVAFHLDCVMRTPTIWVDGNLLPLPASGRGPGEGV
jgi:leucyl aminopeptidase (aminopeptidase T)